MLLVCSLLAAGAVLVSGVYSQGQRQSVPFGTSQTVNVFPTAVSVDGWSGVEKVLSHDLDDDSLYQDFNARNSAFVPQSVQRPAQRDIDVEAPASGDPQSASTASSTAPALDDGADDDFAPSTSTTETSAGATTTDTATSADASVSGVATSAPATSDEASTSSGDGESASAEADPAAVDSDLTPQAESSTTTTAPAPEDEVESVSLLDASRSYVRNVFAHVTRAFPFAQSATTTSLAATSSASTSVSSPNEETSSSSTLAESDASTATSTATTTREATTTTTDEGEVDDEVESEAVQDGSSTATTSTSSSEAETASTTTDEFSASTSTTSASSSPETTGSTTTREAPTHTGPAREIRLRNFDIAGLQSGQFVTGMQLRLSFAAKLEAAQLHSSSYVEVLFGRPGNLEHIGTILIDDEASNAINGGYYLFALPEVDSAQDLAGKEVVVRYAGDHEELESMYLDAAWIEVDTTVVSEKDLQKRAAPEALGHLAKPQRHELISDRVNFTRSEMPHFNLRYNAQRNALVRGVRNVFGQDLVNVSEVQVVHRNVGPLPIDVDVVTTKDGLLTLSVPEADRAKLRPGEYTVELTMEEGGKTFTDSFAFQWGILSINTHKTEYEVGETVDVSMGALTPSGHTICEAELDLYVISPDDFITKVPVRESGLCDGNNVVDEPDFSAEFPVTLAGEYELHLERLNQYGEVESVTSDTIQVVEDQPLALERRGPSRIYPPVPYEVELTVTADEAFTGSLTERVPRSFDVASTSAEVTTDGEWYELTWDISMFAGESETVSYQFDAPDLSPYLYNLGPAEVVSDDYEPSGAEQSTDQPSTDTASTSADTASSTTQDTDHSSSTQPTTSGADTGVYFLEHRQWQIASDAIGNMILFWDGGTIPAGWTCLSCGSGTFFQRFVMGSSTYNTTGGAATHGHAANGTVFQSTQSATESGGGGIAPVGHNHTFTPTISAENNLPEYRQLRVIQYTAAAGEPPTLPAGAIGIFDVAPASLPTGWSQYSAQTGSYIYGEDTPGTTGGSNTHTHAVSGTTGASDGSGTRDRGGPNTTDAAVDGHTHTVSGATASQSNEPPYIEVVLGQLGAAAAPPNGLIAMWTEEVDNGWLDLSSAPGDPFNQRFIKPANSYGATGGTNTHAPADVTGLTSSVPSATTIGRAGSAGSDGTHQHSVDVTGFSTSSHLPPYLTAVFGKRQGVNPVFEQVSSRWYANDDSSLTPSDPWPTGASDLLEQEAVTSASTPVKPGDRLRLRINAAVSNATATPSSGLTLQYAAAPVCSGATSWTAVGSAGAGEVWRGHDNLSLSDQDTLPSTLLASSTIAETYEENGFASSTANAIAPGEVGEWDFVLEHNDAAAGTEYCFRLVEDDGSTFLNYGHYPQLVTNAAPTAPTLSAPFDNEKTASTAPRFRFVTSDPESEKVHYEIQVADNAAFTAPLIDRTTISNSAQFENQVLTSDKTPFISGNLIEFTPQTTLSDGTTYYWRVRARDPEGSDTWGEWSSRRSLTVDTTLTAAAWFQTEDPQFSSNTQLQGVATGSDAVVLATGAATGTVVSSPIDFTDGTRGTAWDSLVFTDDETAGDIRYFVEYLDESDAWSLIPDTDLSGNSSGFDTSPVSLLTLDVETHRQIRIVADLSDAGGSPTLNDWQVNWGFRVETPTITQLFPNEQVGTTTPRFEFTTADPQNNDLTYQIEWAATPDFTAPTTRTSDTAGGFTNIDSAVDTDPFISGDTIQFTVQPADALTASTTYWWRVRAKDTTGADAYSFWTEPRSFTVIPGTDVSTWYQTAAEQFDANVLSGTRSLASDSVTVATTASEAMLVYGEGTLNTPRYRQWNGSAWGDEGSLLSVDAPVRWAVAAAGTTREEYVAVTVGSDADVNAQVFSNGNWTDLQEMTTSVGDTTARGVDVAYETNSGDAMVVYCDGDSNPSYRIWDGTSWSAAGTITTNTTGNCTWVELESNPTSDEIVMVSRDASGSEYEGQVWDGTAWGNATQFGQSRDATYSGIALAYEASGDQAVAVAPSPGGGPNRMVYTTWDGTAWSGETTQTIDGRLYWGELRANVGTDELVLCYQNDNSSVFSIRWDGAGFVGDSELAATVNADTDPGFSCVFEDSTGRDNHITAAFSDATQTNYSIWNTTAWSPAAQINAIGDSATMQLERTGVADILGVFFDDTNDALRFADWDGTSWAGTQTLETDMSVDSSPYGRPYALAPRNSGSEGTTIVSPAIDFTEGLGPYWDSFSWTDTVPGTSQISYQLQYQTATGSWAFIPDTDLAGNSAGFTAGPVDLSGLNTNTYEVIRPYATINCDGVGNCPTLDDWRVTWAGGITVSGSIRQYDQTTAVAGGTVAVAVNGTLQAGKTGSITDGDWSIDNVTAFAGDVITVFVSGAADENEAVGVARYDGSGNLTGMQLYERHLTLGSDDATTTPLTNADIGAYDVTNTEDVFISLASSSLAVCGDSGCGDATLYVNASTTYQPNGHLSTHDLENHGTIEAGGNTLEVSGSWDNTATTSLTNATVVFAATSTSEHIDSSGATVSTFGDVVFGTTTGNGTWTLSSPLDIDGGLTVERGTLARGATAITVAGDLTTGANGQWSGSGTTTLDGSSASAWNDQAATPQSVGTIVVDGSSKLVTLAGDVAADRVVIGANDTLDVSSNDYDITVYENWVNHNSFVSRQGTVRFAATSTGSFITTNDDSFYDLAFTGSSGGWSFTEPTTKIDNDLTVSAGTVTLPSATTTIGGSFDTTGGTFVNNNGVLYFTADTVETITFDGGAFTNTANDVVFDGGGSWSITDANATTSQDLRIEQGSVTFPSGTLAIGGTLHNDGGTFLGNNGTARFYSSASETITTGGGAFASVAFVGTGDWTFTDSDVTATEDLAVTGGTVALPSGTFSLGGSYTNTATVNAGTGTLRFDSTDTGETVDAGSSPLHTVEFASPTGGWTLTGSATTTNDFTIATATDWTLASGRSLAVGGVFTNAVGGASTTWTGATLSLYGGGEYSINTKSTVGDVYDTLAVQADTDVAMWNSLASNYDIDSTGSLYSQDHNAADGDLYIFGDYRRATGTEYWSYETDFDGTTLGTSSVRAVDVRVADGASVTVASSTLAVAGADNASTTVANQGSGTYTVAVQGGTTTAQYYEFRDLGASGVSLLASSSVVSLANGSFEPAIAGGAGLTVDATTIDANPTKQIFNVRYATTTAISATNVAQTGGTPSSYWWFRDGTGNLYGEAFDNDTGDPGSIRFDDSSLLITVSGTVYADAGVTPLTSGTCDDTTHSVRLVVNGTTSYTASCSSADGSFSIPNVTVVGDPTLTLYLDDASGGERASAITRTPTADITDFDLYVDRVIVRNEDTSPLAIANLARFDHDDDTDLAFTAATSTGTDLLTTQAGTELFVFASSTFAPGGDVTLRADAQGNGYDGTLSLDQGASFVGSGTSTYQIGGRFVLASGASFTPASSTLQMTATTTGQSITATDEVDFHHLTFAGSGGGWNLGADIRVNGDMTLDAGTVTGTGDITLPNGSLTGDGVLSLGAGTTTLAASNTLGGGSAWTFHDLVLGTGAEVGTTTPLFTSTTTISGQLMIGTAHFLDAGATSWDLAGTGTVFIEDGSFLEDTSTIRYSGAGSDVLSTTYYNLAINAGAGSPTYPLTGLGAVVENDLTIGGDAASTFDLATNDPALDVNGDIRIAGNGTLLASDAADLTIAGSYDNNGTFTANDGTLTFDGSASSTIAAGSSEFASVLIDGAADVTMSESATATAAFTLASHNSFTLASGETLAVGGTFNNETGGAATTWSGATLALYGGGNYAINGTSTSESYETLRVDNNTQIRMWNSEATSYDVVPDGSLYSQDHAGVDGDLYIWGDYRSSSAADTWSYARDFDGTALGGNARKVDVSFADGASVTVTGGALAVIGDSNASTTVQSQSGGSYSLHIGGSASTTLQHYELRDMDSAGLTFSGSPDVTTLSNGDYEVSTENGSALTVGGSVIDANPAKNFVQTRFALAGGVSNGTNVTATGTSVSSWRFTNHTGGIDGESFDVDPGGDPGYVSWDDSAALVTIAGSIYSDEGSTVSSACDDSTTNVSLYVDGVLEDSVSCDAATGAYSFSNVAFSANDAVIVYIDGETTPGATVSADLVSNISNFDVYEDRVVVRHEGTDPLTIADMSVWDSSDDADVPFTTVTGSPNTLTLPSNTKLLVWGGKTFSPGGDVSVPGGGYGSATDGTIELREDAAWNGADSEDITIGGSFLLQNNATFMASNGTTTFTSWTTGRTIDVNESAFGNVAFTGSGGWSVSDATLTINGDYRQTDGSVTLPTGTTTVSGAFVNNGGSFDANGGLLRLAGTGAHELATDGSDLAELRVTGTGSYSMTDTSATTTAGVTVAAGTLALPNGRLAVGGDFVNEAGTITPNTAELVLTNPGSISLQASSSDLYGVTVTNGGALTMVDEDLTLLDSLVIDNGSATLASGTLSIGGSFDASGGTFDHASGTILFNSGDTGEVINPGVSDLYTVQISAPSGGYTIAASATTTNDFTLASANDFTQQSGTRLTVAGVFTNNVGGAATTWSGSTLDLVGGDDYPINTKSSGDQYDTLVIGPNSAIRAWNSAATTTTVADTSSFYSQDHAGVDGALAVYGDFVISTTTEYWSYETDFDGDDLSGGSERAVTVSIADGASTTLSSGRLNMVGSAGNETTVTNQTGGTYAFTVSGGTFNADHYAFRNFDANGLHFSGSPTILALSNGDFEVVQDSGTAITLPATTLNANASLVITGMRFATTTAISATNIALSGSTPSVWSITGYTGNLAGEAYDVDGATECGSLRWDDSSCLITQQTHYRWRNDDGSLGAPNSEWYHQDWSARQSVRVDNGDGATYTDAAVRLLVPYDTDMQSDFDDLRFTDASGTTTVPHWVGSTTPSTVAEVWVQVPELPANDTATLYMYYDNPAATSSSANTAVFTAADDFEDGDISEYSGETSDFTVDGTFAYAGNNGLDATGNEDGRTQNGGIFRFDQTVSQGETVRFQQYVDTTDGSGDETCTLFGVQSPGTTNQNYAVCLEQFGVDRMSIVRDAVDNDASGTILASSTVSYATGWYTVEVDWATDGTISASLLEQSGTVVASTTATDNTYTSGGYGFTFWFQYGGWDSFTSRPLLNNEPTTRFGGEQTDGGASWAAPLDTTADNFSVNDTARLRIAIENSGLAINDQEFLLEYAEQGGAPSCEAVDSADFNAVPVQSSCGSSPVCMQGSTNVTNGASVADLLLGTDGTFATGEAREDPSNITDPIDLRQNTYTEVEYVVTPTTNVADQNLCFRVTDNGATYDTYLQVPKMEVRFDPSFGPITLNGGQDIALALGTTTEVLATGTVTDLNGYTDLANATATIYRSGAGAACSPDENNCYVAAGASQCEFTNCAGNSCTLECRADIQFFAEPTDFGTYSGEEWLAYLEVSDQSGGIDVGSAPGVEMQTNRALAVDGTINYGTLEINEDTGSFNASTTILNYGNVAIDVDIEGGDLSDGGDSTIPADRQRVATSTFTYSACTACSQLSTSTTVTAEMDLTKPDSLPTTRDELYWGIAIPFGINSAPHQGINTFYAVDD